MLSDSGSCTLYHEVPRKARQHRSRRGAMERQVKLFVRAAMRYVLIDKSLHS